MDNSKEMPDASEVLQVAAAVVRRINATLNDAKPDWPMAAHGATWLMVAALCLGVHEKMLADQATARTMTADDLERCREALDAAGIEPMVVVLNRVTAQHMTRGGEA